MIAWKASLECFWVNGVQAIQSRQMLIFLVNVDPASLNAKGPGSPLRYFFLSHILNSLLARTCQCSLASTDTDRLGSTSGTLLKIMYSHKMGEFMYKSLGPHASFNLFDEKLNAVCICHWCSFNVSFCALSSRDWIMAFYMLSAQLSH